MKGQYQVYFVIYDCPFFNIASTSLNQIVMFRNLSLSALGSDLY